MNPSKGPGHLFHSSSAHVTFDALIACIPVTGLFGVPLVTGAVPAAAQPFVLGGEAALPGADPKVLPLSKELAAIAPALIWQASKGSPDPTMSATAVLTSSNSGHRQASAPPSHRGGGSSGSKPRQPGFGQMSRLMSSLEFSRQCSYPYFGAREKTKMEICSAESRKLHFLLWAVAIEP